MKLFENEDSRLFSYVVKDDFGCAPNPYNGYCTLAICKPAIRRIAKKGDVVVGLDCKSSGNKRRIVYCMIIDDVLTWSEYINKCKTELPFNNRIPKNNRDTGDCIWIDIADDKTKRALPSLSGHNGDADFASDIERGKNVLISQRFWYFGTGNEYKVVLPDDIDIIPARNHRSKTNHGFRDKFEDFIVKKMDELKISGYGKHGNPKPPPTHKANQNSCTQCQSKPKKTRC
ncbi:hypothetical protein [Hydromonas duriensis]|uniref:Nucleotide modification associated domain-containing protein n=1 Tax=Hydromonas duriensis TaxID=1527608 RepID=A0A4R6Y998_9BURK|nr:hypothetical protein [Hydromonas duriensis]TDR31996.1 hypothetical protein DFR44_10659 [Hydromonas duriensis]